jgi:creatinine amidohydrolase
VARRLDWADHPHGAFAGMDPDRTIAILATAAIEQHGPHLPVGTDMMIAAGMLERLRGACPDDLDILVLPVQAVGKSDEHLHAAGTLSLPASAVLAAWTEIGLSVARAGLRKLVIVNSHGGNSAVNDIIVRDLRLRAGMLAVTCGWGAFGVPEGMFSTRELEFGLHGGDWETSLMLAFRPDLVDMGRASDFPSSAETAPVPPTGPAHHGWIATDLNPEGVTGEAHLASAAKGRAAADHAVAGFIDLLRRVAAMPPPD